MEEKQLVEQPVDEAGVEYVERIEEYVDNRRQRTILAALFVILFLLLIGTAFYVMRLTRAPGTPTSKIGGAAGMTWVRSIYGWGKGHDQALVNPTDVAVAEDGTIWTLSEHHLIAAFNPDGSLKRVIKPKIGASLEGLDVAENGDLYVADYGGAVYHFQPDGKLLATYRVQLPNEVDVRDGKIAVAAANGVAVFTADDRILAQFGTRGRGEDQFDLPHGIALAQDGNIYVSDTHNRRVRAYTPSGRLIWSLGEGARGDNKDWRSVETSGTFELPAGMTIDGAGRIVLVDPFKFEIIAVDAKTGKVARADGKLARYGDFGQADGMFNFPTGIAYDRTRDWFVVADTQNNRLQIVRLPGSGGSIVAPLMSSFSPPMLVCFLPLLLLLIAAIVMVMRRRRELMSEQPGEPGSTPAA